MSKKKKNWEKNISKTTDNNSRFLLRNPMYGSVSKYHRSAVCAAPKFYNLPFRVVMSVYLSTRYRYITV